MEGVMSRADDHVPHDHDHGEIPSDVALRVKALESLLVEKGLVDPAAWTPLLRFLSIRSDRTMGPV
jgi:nitrile hydratase subunit alpha